MRKLACTIPLLFACGSDPVDPPAPTVPPECAQIATADIDALAFTNTVRCLDGHPDLDEATALGFVEAFAAAVEARGGFPIVDGDQVHFAYLRTREWDAEDDKRSGENFDETFRHPPLKLTGAFVDWDPAAGPEFEAGPFGFFHLSAPLADVEGRGYRLVAHDSAGNPVTFSDPKSRRYDFFADGRRSLIRGDTTRGHIEQLGPLPATALGRPRKLHIYVPPGYDQAEDRYPVLYMHDGNNLYDTTQHRCSEGGTWDVDGVFEDELAEGNVAPGIVVGVPNSNERIDEYTHLEEIRGGTRQGGEGDAYLDFLVNEVKPAVDARYRTRPEREHTGVMGSSLGGLISFYAGLEHPEVFRFVGGMSSTFIWGRIGVDGPSMLELYTQADLSGRDQVFYLDAGGGPDPVCPAGDDNYCELIEMRDILRDKGFDSEAPDVDATPLPEDVNMMWIWRENAPHNESSWRVRLHRPLRLFFRP